MVYLKGFYKLLRYLVIILWIVINVYLFLTVDKTSHSVSDTLYGFVPLFIETTVPVIAVLWVNNLLINDKGNTKKAKK